MIIDFKKIQIDEELEDLLPRLLEDDLNSLTQSLLRNGFEQKFGRIKVWFPEDNDGTGYIVDGHNRYKICSKNGIELSDYCFEPVYFDTKEEVVKWMLENQLARRNLSSAQRIAVAEKYRPIYEKQAKENQSLGGGDKKSENYQKSVVSNLTQAVDKKRNPTTDEKLSKIAGIKTTTYKMGAKVLKSDNEDLKKRVLSGETSISAGYKELMMNRNKNPKPTEKEPTTPEQKIVEFDDRMNEIDREISSLRTERESLMRRRRLLFESLNIPCELKYEFVEKEYNYFSSRDCRFFIEVDGHKQIFVECGVYCNENPDSLYINEIPEKYKNDFIMLWKKAHREEVEYSNEQAEKRNKEFEKKYKEALINDISKCSDFYKQCYRILAKCVHPDEGGDVEAMKCLNQLKIMWGI